MKIVLERVKEASVTLRGEGSPFSRIGPGYLLLVGFERGDDGSLLPPMARKIAALRLFEDENGKTNRSILIAGGDVLAVSQFTLLAELRRAGNRPSFGRALGRKEAEPLYELFLIELGKVLPRPPARGVFGAEMEVRLVNDGPFTIILDSREVIA